MTVPYHHVEVSFLTGSITTQLPAPNFVLITEREYHHDLAQLVWWGGDVDASALLSGSPLTVKWGNAAGDRVFYGYVNHAQRTNDSLSMGDSVVERNALTVTCVGASWPMKQTDTKSFRQQTITQAVAQVAQLFNFNTSITGHLTLWPALQMAGMTYWEFCVRLAKRIGYSFYANACTLVMKPRDTDPTKLGSLAAVYDYRADPGSFPVFLPTLGAANTSGGLLRTRRLAGVDARTNSVVFAQVAGNPATAVLGTVVDAPPFISVEHEPVASQAEANIKAAGLGALNQLYITAEAKEVVGNVRVSKGTLIFVQNANGAQNGLWYVQCAVHRLTPLGYKMDLELGRDSRGATPSVVLRPIATLPQPPGLVGGQWRGA